MKELVNPYAQAFQLQTCRGSSLEEDVANKVRGGSALSEVANSRSAMGKA